MLRDDGHALSVGWSDTRTVPSTRTNEATDGILRGRRLVRSVEGKTIIGGS